MLIYEGNDGGASREDRVIRSAIYRVETDARGADHVAHGTVGRAGITRLGVGVDCRQCEEYDGEKPPRCETAGMQRSPTKEGEEESSLLAKAA